MTWRLGQHRDNFTFTFVSTRFKTTLGRQNWLFFNFVGLYEIRLVCDTIKRDLLYCVLLEFTVPRKPLTVIQRWLTEMYRKLNFTISPTLHNKSHSYIGRKRRGSRARNSVIKDLRAHCCNIVRSWKSSFDRSNFLLWRIVSGKISSLKAPLSILYVVLCPERRWSSHFLFNAVRTYNPST
jgi:hypothetical protein